MNDAITQAKFCIENPDVMHTGHQYREIIKGLLELLTAAPKPDERVD